MRIIIRGGIDSGAWGFRRFVIIGRHCASLNASDFFTFLALGLADMYDTRIDNGFLHLENTGKYIYRLRKELLKQTTMSKDTVNFLVSSKRSVGYRLITSDIQIPLSLDQERQDDGRIDILLKHLDINILTM